MFKIFSICMALFVAMCFAAPMGASGNPETPVASDGSIFFAPATGAVETEVTESYMGTGKTTAAFKDSPAEYAALKALLPISAEVGIETLIGADTRTRVYTTRYPARAIALITFSAGRCTGFMVGANTVATAGHCVHSGGSSGAWYPTASYTIYPGKNQASNPYGSCTAKSLHSVTGWTTDGNEESDYGAIKLNCTVGNLTGWFRLWAPTTVNGLTAVIGGYPGDKTLLDQWWSMDEVRTSTANQVFYKNDTIGGMSGSPVWQDVPPGILSSNGVYAFAIHAYGLHGAPPHSTHNHGTRLTPARISNYNYWIGLP